LSQLNPDRHCQSRLGGKKKTGALLKPPILARDLATNIDDLFSIYRGETICNPIGQASNQRGQYLIIAVVYLPGQWL
jgi:hypothetical protein